MTAKKTIKYDQVQEFFEKHIKGCAYTGTFRPDHRVFVYDNHGEVEIFEKFEASGNYSFQSIDPVQVFHNGFEGRFDLEGAVWLCVVEEDESYIKPYIPGLPGQWGEMEDEEKVNWLMRHKKDECKNIFENTWDYDLSEYLMPYAIDRLEEEGWEIEY